MQLELRDLSELFNLSEPSLRASAHPGCPRDALSKAFSYFSAASPYSADLPSAHDFAIELLRAVNSKQARPESRTFLFLIEVPSENALILLPSGDSLGLLSVSSANAFVARDLALSHLKKLVGARPPASSLRVLSSSPESCLYSLTLADSPRLQKSLGKGKIRLVPWGSEEIPKQLNEFLRKVSCDSHLPGSPPRVTKTFSESETQCSLHDCVEGGEVESEEKAAERRVVRLRDKFDSKLTEILGRFDWGKREK